MHVWLCRLNAILIFLSLPLCLVVLVGAQWIGLHKPINRTETIQYRRLVTGLMLIYRRGRGMELM